MDFNLTPEQEAFRTEVREFLDANLPVTDRREWLRKVREKRWVGFSWPKHVGGGGGGIMEQFILKEEMTKRQAPALGACYMGLAWVGPALIEYGTPEQQARFIPDILDSKYQWCTGYSEPGAGSDLAALQCRAERDGEVYRVNGQKIWTSLAPVARWMILLVRTQPEVSVKHEGITCLLVDMKSPGIEVRPIRAMNGSLFFAEVFFTDVEVPVDQRLGNEGEGWQVTLSALANERSSIAEVEALQRKLDQIKKLARGRVKNGRPVLEDHGMRRRIARIETRIEAMRYSGMRFLTQQLRGETLSSETSINKLHRAALEVEFGEIALEIQGLDAPYVAGSEAALDDGRWQQVALSWPEVVIGGGTPNIQRNIIAERLLGLPKD